MSSTGPASTTLLGFVTQMAQIEATISSIVFELVLKLSSLTEANIFLLVESSDGRRFAGKKQLCDAYMQGALMSLGGETEVALSGLSTLEERRLDGGLETAVNNPYVNHGAALHQEARARSGRSDSRSPTTPFYQDAPHHPLSSHGRKRSSGNDHPLTAFDASTVKQPRMMRHSPPNRVERPEDLSCEVTKVEEEPETVFEDGVEKEEHNDSREEHDGSRDDMAMVYYRSDDSLNQSLNQSFESRALGDLSLARPDAAAFAAGAEELDQYFAGSDKVLAVKSIPLEKLKALDSQSQSFEYKLFTSTLYDISKLAARCSPSYDKKNISSKAHFHNIFERVWSEFTFLEMLAQMGVQPKNGFSMRNFVRATMQKTYGHILDKLLQNSIKPKEAQADGLVPATSAVSTLQHGAIDPAALASGLITAGLLNPGLLTGPALGGQ